MREDRDRRRERDGFPDPGTTPIREPTRQELQKAIDWLRKLLKQGPIYQQEAARLAEAAGIPGSLLKKAKKAADVKSENYNDENDLAEYKVWFWSLPKRKRVEQSDATGEPWDDDE